MSDDDVQLASVYARVPDRRNGREPQPVAEVNVNLAAPFPSWKWVRLQLLTANWVTLALMLTVLAVSRGIDSQVQEMRKQASDAKQRYDDLHALMTRAAPVADQLTRMDDELHRYNDTLNLAMAQGLNNLSLW